MSSQPSTPKLDDTYPVNPQDIPATTENTEPASEAVEAGKEGEAGDGAGGGSGERNVGSGEEAVQVDDTADMGETKAKGLEGATPVKEEGVQAAVDSEDEVDGDLGDAGMHSKQESEAGEASHAVQDPTEVVEGEAVPDQGEDKEDTDAGPSETAPSVPDQQEGEPQPSVNPDGSNESNTILPASDNEPTIVPAPSSPADPATTPTTSSFVRAPTATGTTPTLTSTAPKKFSAVNLNRKFLGKTGSPSPSNSVPNLGGLGGKASVGLGGLGSSPTASRTLASTKLTKIAPTSSIPPNASSPSGWSKPITPTSTGPGKELASADLSRSSSLTGAGFGTKKQGLVSSSSQASGSALITKKEKKGWGNLPSAGAAAGGSSARDFPTATEVVEGQRAAAQNAQALAQAQAAHTRALLQGLDAFRGANRDPNAHYWDEDDEDMSFDQVVDFGDGTTYTIPAVPPPVQRPDDTPDVPVSKSERFQEDFDRSWPPKAPALPMPPPPQKKEPESAAAAASRVLFNERSNKMEPPAERARKAHPPVAANLPPRAAKDTKAPERTKERTLSTPSGFERAPPPHLAASREPDRPKDVPSKPSTSASIPPRGLPNPRAPLDRALPPHLAAPPANAPTEQRGTVRPPPVGLSDRPLPPHMAGKPEDRQPATLSRTRSRDLPDRRLSDANNHLSGGALGRVQSREGPDSGLTNRPTGGYLSAGRNPSLSPTIRRAAPVQSFGVTVQPLVAPTAPLPAIVDVNITEMQKNEMHTAAERARARREAEEAEREAAKNRAKQKAKELEDRIKAMAGGQAAPAVAVKSPIPPPAVAAPPPPPGLSLRQPFARAELDLSQSIARGPNPPILLQRPAPAGVTSGFDRLAVTRQIPQPQAGIERQPPSHLLASVTGQQSGFNEIPRNSFTAPERHAPQNLVYSSARQPDVPDVSTRIAYPIMSPPVVAVKEHGLVSPQPPAAMATPRARIERPDALAAAALRSVRTDRIDEPSWRSKATPAAPRPVEVYATQAVIPVALPVEPVVVEDPIVSKTTPSESNGPASPMKAATAETPQPLTTQKPVRDTTSFEAILARIKAAMVDESPKVVLQEAVAQLAEVQSEAPVPPPIAEPKITLTQAPAAAPERQITPPPVPQPRPDNFLVTQNAMPDPERPAWNTLLIKVPRSGRKTLSRQTPHSPTAFRSQPAPEDFLVSWDPPLAQLNPVSMSRDEMLMGQQYYRGKLVSVVKLPTATLQRQVRSGSLDAANVQGTTQHITVKLPVVSPKAKSTTRSEQPVPEDSSSLSTTSSAAAVLPPLSRQKSPRKPDMAVSFAKPLPAASATAEARSSVRFLMESHLEDADDSELLDEVLSTRQEAIDVGGQDNGKEVQNGVDMRQDGLKSQKDFGLPSPTSPPPSKSSKHLYPISQSPGRQLTGVDKAHIKSVWSSQPSSEVGGASSTNSLKGIADDLPQFSMPMGDLPETKDDRELVADHPTAGSSLIATQEDSDTPQFASVSAAPVLPLEPSVTGSSGFTGFANGYQASQASFATASNASTEPRSASQNQYAAYPGAMHHVQSHLVSDPALGQANRYPTSAASPQYGMLSYSAEHPMGQAQQVPVGYLNSSTAGRSVDGYVHGMVGISGSHGGQSGMWMPVAQYQNAQLPQNGAPNHIYGPQIPANGNSMHKVAHLRGSGPQAHSHIGSTPSPVQYRSNLPGQGHGDQYNGNMLYSNSASGPLDSPVMPYAATRQYGNNANQNYSVGGGGGGYGGETGYGMQGQGQYPSAQLQSRDSYQNTPNHGVAGQSRSMQMQMQLAQSSNAPAGSGYGLAVGSLAGQGNRMAFDNANHHGQGSASFRGNGANGISPGAYGSVGAVMGASTGAGSYLGHGQGQQGNRSSAGMGGNRGGNGVIGSSGNRRVW